MQSRETAAYAGIKVLDLSQGMAGPLCPMLLEKFGAEVIKVEPPAGDWIRVMGGGDAGMTALAVANNLGKRSICIDATRAEGRSIVEQLARSADVLVENFRPGVMDRLGLGHDALSRLNPRLIYVSISGFGDSGPLVNKPATDSVLQAMTGMAVANRTAAGEPRRIGLFVPDTITALYAVQCVGAALYARDAATGGTGRGRHVALSLAECCASFQSAAIVEDFLFAGQSRPPVAVPAGLFATRDGHMVLAATNEAMWKGVCQALGHEDWLADPRFATKAGRCAHEGEILAEVARILAQRSTEAWSPVLDANDVLFAPVQDYRQLCADRQMIHMRYFAQVDQAPYGVLPLPRAPGSDRDAAIGAAPRAGEHTREILAELGYGAEQIAQLERDGFVKSIH